MSFSYSATVDLLELLDVRLRTMWRHDDRGRITTTNRPEGCDAPRLVVSRSAAGAAWRVGPAVTEAQVRHLAPLLAAADDWRSDTPPNLGEILEVLGGGEIDGGPDYRPATSMAEPAGETVVVTAADAALLELLLPD